MLCVRQFGVVIGERLCARCVTVSCGFGGVSFY